MKLTGAGALSRASDQGGVGVSDVPAAEFRVAPERVVPQLERHVLLDGIRLVVDFEQSRGCHFTDAVTGREWLDFYGFYGSMPLGFRHPAFDRPDVQREILQAARSKVANSDVCSAAYATFVSTFQKVMGLPPLNRFFFIEGGALAVENALKAAMDWKVRKNIAAGRGAVGTEILHFENAFHGRSGYTLSLTNTDPLKTDHFAKFDWPRVPAPAINFALAEPERTRDVTAREHQVEAQLRQVLAARSGHIAAIIIEPIQGEGGDCHFRGEWLVTLRRLCDQYELLLIFDEVQTGFGTTGRNWCCEHFGVMPDLLAFGKKAQVCGVMAGPRLDEVADNCFRLPGRLNSTWGGNLVDMVRATHCLRIIEEERLVQNARELGDRFLEGLRELCVDETRMTAPRGRGLMLAFDLPDPPQRDQFHRGLFDLGLLALKSGRRSIRFRPVLDISAAAVEQALELIREQCQRMRTTSIAAPELDRRRSSALSPPDRERDRRRSSTLSPPDRERDRRRSSTLSPSDGERAGERGAPPDATAKT